MIVVAWDPEETCLNKCDTTSACGVCKKTKDKFSSEPDRDSLYLHEGNVGFRAPINKLSMYIFEWAFCCLVWPDCGAAMHQLYWDDFY